ncbi:MAG: metallophosphoesterase family protein [Spirochaeta sp.]
MSEFSINMLSKLHTSTKAEPLPDDRPSVIFSDFHVGDGSIKDDFLHNAELAIEVLEEYYRRGFRLILNGDIEELQKFPLEKIVSRWPALYKVFDRFHAEGRLIRIAGNHDLQLLYDNPFPVPVREGLRYSHGDNDIFIFHGHQASRRYSHYNDQVGWMLKHVVGRLPVRNISVSHDNRKKKRLEERVYAFSSRQKVLSIIGHTHRPLFESLSKTDYVKYNIERLCRQYGSAKNGERVAIRGEIEDLRTHLARTVPNRRRDFGAIYHDSFVVPCLFNSGCVLGKRGITCIELDSSSISLKYWFDMHRSKRYLRYDGYETVQLPGSDHYETIIKSENLDYIFSRIHLLA